MDDAQLLRYSRHILLPELGIEAQQKFAAAHALVVGVGGLGAPVAQFLAASGIGTLTLADPDTRRSHQPAAPDPVRDARTSARARSMRRAHASRRSIRTFASRRSPRGSDPTISHRSSREADVVVDCCDNFATRHAVNRACVAARKPLVSGAAIRFDGQIAVFDARDRESRATTACSAKARTSRRCPIGA